VGFTIKYVDCASWGHKKKEKTMLHLERERRQKTEKKRLGFGFESIEGDGWRFFIG